MASHSIVTPMRSPTLSLLVRTVLLESGSSDRKQIRYSSHAHLREVLRPLLQAAWEDARDDMISRFPAHRVVLGRTRFVPHYPGDPKPKGVFEIYDGNVVGQFLSQCDDLFATSRAGTKCRASGNLANPPTHNAVYLDVDKILHIKKLPGSGEINFFPSSVTDILRHEMLHAIDILSSVTHGDQIRDSQDVVLTELINWEALKSKQELLDQIEDRLIRAGGSDDGITEFLGHASQYWDHYVGGKWLTKRNELVAVVMALSSILEDMGLTGPEFLGLNIADESDEIKTASSGVLDYPIVMLMYGIIDEGGAVGLDGIRKSAL